MLTEVISETHYDPQADIYSFGISFFEVLTCKKPYLNNTNVTDNVFRLHGALKSGLRPGPLPREPQKVITLISNCWQTDPTQRPSAKDVLKELNTITYQR